jgi:hypothetical protein
MNEINERVNRVRGDEARKAMLKKRFITNALVDIAERSQVIKIHRCFAGIVFYYTKETKVVKELLEQARMFTEFDETVDYYSGQAYYNFYNENHLQNEFEWFRISIVER